MEHTEISPVIKYYPTHISIASPWPTFHIFCKVSSSVHFHSRSRNIGGVAKILEIYAAAHGGHLFYDYFLQIGGGGMAPLPPPLDPLLVEAIRTFPVFL